jgi:F0F1-type ATP synthase membrane subunit b/b'
MNENVAGSDTNGDVQALRAELKNLRADFSKVTELLKDTARNRGAEAADKLRATAEQGWNEAKSTAQSVIEEMEERPLATVAAVFVAGVLFGLMLGGRR